MRKARLLFIILGGAFLVLSAQGTETFDYHRQESPAISWNGTTLYDARLLALGGISFFPSIPFQATRNPAIITNNSLLNVGLTYNSSRYQSFQYWGINQGVIYEPSNQSDRSGQISGISGSLKYKKFALSMGWLLANYLRFPDFAFSWSFSQYSGDFSGGEHSFFAALAWQPATGLTLGTKIARISGERRLMTTLFEETQEYDEINHLWRRYEIYIEQEEIHRRRHWALTVGTTIHLTPSWKLGVACQLPFSGQVSRQVDRRFRNPQAGIKITSPQTCTDQLHVPKHLTIGTFFTIPLRGTARSKITLNIAAEAKHTFWQEYHLIVFGEEVPREMHNTSELAAGLELKSLSPRRELSFRFACRLDPQPVTTPAATLLVFSGGMGLKIKNLSADLGLAYITTQSDIPEQYHWVLNGSLGFQL